MAHIKIFNPLAIRKCIGIQNPSHRNSHSSKNIQWIENEELTRTDTTMKGNSHTMGKENTHLHSTTHFLILTTTIIQPVNHLISNHSIVQISPQPTASNHFKRTPTALVNQQNIKRGRKGKCHQKIADIKATNPTTNSPLRSQPSVNNTVIRKLQPPIKTIRSSK